MPVFVFNIKSALIPSQLLLHSFVHLPLRSVLLLIIPSRPRRTAAANQWKSFANDELSKHAMPHFVGVSANDSMPGLVEERASFPRTVVKLVKPLNAEDLLHLLRFLRTGRNRSKPII